jgi:glycosyltransferase involved in cell wall biosynthesis
MGSSIDVLIACYNEEPTIEQVVREHLEVLRNSQVFDQFQITVLDDGCTDNSRTKIATLVNEFSEVQLITNEYPSGINKAFNKLFKSTKHDWVYFTSGDGQYPAVILEDLLKQFDSNFDLFIAKRTNKVEIYTSIRLLVSTFYRLIVLIVSGKDPIDAGSTKLIRRKLFAISFVCKYLARDAEIIVSAKKNGNRVKVVSTKFESRTAGKSSIRLWVVFKTLFDSLRLIRYRF